MKKIALAIALIAAAAFANSVTNANTQITATTVPCDDRDCGRIVPCDNRDCDRTVPCDNPEDCRGDRTVPCDDPEDCRGERTVPCNEPNCDHGVEDGNGKGTGDGSGHTVPCDSFDCN